MSRNIRLCYKIIKNSEDEKYICIKISELNSYHIEPEELKKLEENVLLFLSNTHDCEIESICKITLDEYLDKDEKIKKEHIENILEKVNNAIAEENYNSAMNALYATSSILSIEF